MRDDFTTQTKEILAKRVGYKCSNPNCRKPTVGPRSEDNKTVNVGIAAHVTAASEGGPRYDGKLKSSERKDVKNGIWLCQNCAKLIDNDSTKYTVELIYKWKEISELSASLEIESGGTNSEPVINVENSPNSINTLNQVGDNTVIAPTVDVRRPITTLQSVLKTNEPTVESPWQYSTVNGLLKTVVEVNIFSKAAINHLDISMRHDSLYCIVPNATQMIVHESHRKKTNNDFVFLKLINPQNGLYTFTIYHTSEIQDIVPYVEFHWSNEIWRLRK